MTGRFTYETDGAAIYRQSFAMIRQETDLTRFTPEQEQVAVRIIHAAGDTDIAEQIEFSAGAVQAARQALAAGAPIFTDVNMVASGVTRKRLPANNDVLCLIKEPQAVKLAAQLGTTRSAAAVELWLPQLAGAVVAIGNAPTALFHLLNILAADPAAPRPACIIGMPVGFVGAAESKAALAASAKELGIEYITVHGRRGGSAMTCAAINAVATAFEIMPETKQEQNPSKTGKLLGVGVGPGDPDLVTLAAVKAIQSADVVAYHSKKGHASTARQIVAQFLRSDQIEEQLEYPVTVEPVAAPASYEQLLAEFYQDATAKLAAHLQAGKTVALLALGDPMLYSSHQHLHRELAQIAPTEIIPGISSVTAAADVLGQPLAEGEETLTILPGTLPEDQLAAKLSTTDAAVIMKLGRTFSKVKAALKAAGKADRAYIVSRIGLPGQKVIPVLEADPQQIPYFAVAVVPSTQGQNPAGVEPGQGEVVVVGLGPGPQRWQTPEATAALQLATDIVGYSTYVNRVPDRPGQTKHLSDNRVEAQRADFALELAKQGRRVAVVSSGDAGVFAMAAAVLEQANTAEFRDVPVRIVPGMTAAQAVASRVGAPLGHDFGMISLSQYLKPWAQIEKRLQALLAADMAFACYNPASKTRRDAVVRLKELALQYRDPATPVIVARAVGTAAENVQVVPLHQFDPEQVDMQTMVIMGASNTQSYAGADGVRVFTARHYNLPKE